MNDTETGFRLIRASVRAGGRSLLDCSDLLLRPGRICGVIGRNGAGKSTLLRLLARQIAPDDGVVRLDGQDIAAIPVRAFARRVAHMAQSAPPVDTMRLRDLVALGRFPWHGAFGRMRAKDEASVDQALLRTGLEALADRPLCTLSGGELQRGRLAMMMAQGSDWLILDEPSAALDLAWALELLRQLRVLSREGKGVIIALHDMNLAARFCDDLLIVHHGKIIAHGELADIFQPDLLSRVFNVPIDVTRISGRVIALPGEDS